MAEPLWTVKQVADHVGVHTKTIYTWVHEGAGPPSYRLGKYIRFKPADVMTWFEAHRQEPNGTS